MKKLFVLALAAGAVGAVFVYKNRQQICDHFKNADDLAKDIENLQHDMETDTESHIKEHSADEPLE